MVANEATATQEAAPKLVWTTANFWYGRCCGKAAKRMTGFCVCAYQTECPDHGVQCWGSHD